MRFGDLQAAVVASYDRLGMPAWPNPHPGATSAREDEYSRVTDPGRYVVVHERARIWADQLAALPDVDIETLLPGAIDDRRRYDRGVRLTSSRPDMLPLVLLECGGLSHALLHIGVARPEVLLATLPDCGCDACDYGSDDLLMAVDDKVATVVAGPLALLRGAGWQAMWHPHGGESGGVGARIRHREMVDLCRRMSEGERVRLPRGAEGWVGRSWMD